jgi:hypothetical protein
MLIQCVCVCACVLAATLARHARDAARDGELADVARAVRAALAVLVVAGPTFAAAQRPLVRALVESAIRRARSSPACALVSVSCRRLAGRWCARLVVCRRWSGAREARPVSSSPWRVWRLAVQQAAGSTTHDSGVRVRCGEPLAGVRDSLVVVVVPSTHARSARGRLLWSRTRVRRVGC